jgi:hypothetical protein
MSELNIVKYVGIVYNRNNTYDNVTPDDNKNFLTLSNIVINNINNDIIVPIRNHNSGYYVGDKYDDLVKIFTNSELIGSDKTLENNDYPYLYRSSSNNINPHFILELRPINISLMKDIIIYNSNNVSVLEKFCLVLFNDTHIIKTFPLQTVLVQTVDLHNVESLNIYDNIDELTVKTKDKTTVYLELKELLKHLISEKKSPTVENNLTVDTQYIDEINTKLNNINLNLNNNILDINNMKNSSNDILSDLNKFKFDILNQISSNTIDPNLLVASNLTVDTKHINEINAKLNNINSNLNRNILDISNMKNSSNDILLEFNKFKSDILNQISSNTINPNLSVASINPNLPVTSNNSYQSQTNDVPLSETYNNIINRNNFNRLKRMAIHKII